MRSRAQFGWKLSGRPDSASLRWLSMRVAVRKDIDTPGTRKAARAGQTVSHPKRCLRLPRMSTTYYERSPIASSSSGAPSLKIQITSTLLILYSLKIHVRYRYSAGICKAFSGGPARRLGERGRWRGQQAPTSSALVRWLSLRTVLRPGVWPGPAACATLLCPMRWYIHVLVTIADSDPRQHCVCPDSGVRSSTHNEIEKQHPT